VWLTVPSAFQEILNVCCWQCDEFKIYYYPKNQIAFLPLTSTNQALFDQGGYFNKYAYAFTYVFKKVPHLCRAARHWKMHHLTHAPAQWMECTAKTVTATSSGNAAKPDGWDCEVEKRCVCLSCTMGSDTDTVRLAALHCAVRVLTLVYCWQPGDGHYTGEPCSCDAAPESVQG